MRGYGLCRCLALAVCRRLRLVLKVKPLTWHGRVPGNWLQRASGGAGASRPQDGAAQQHRQPLPQPTQVCVLTRLGAGNQRVRCCLISSMPV